MIEFKAYTNEDGTVNVKSRADGKLEDVTVELTTSVEAVLDNIVEKLEQKGFLPMVIREYKLIMMGALVAKFIVTEAGKEDDEEFCILMAETATDFLEGNIALKQSEGEADGTEK